MKQSYFIQIFIFVLFVFTIGCKRNWLDVKTNKNLSVPSTLDDFELLLDNTDLNGVSVTLGEVASDGHYIREVSWATLSEQQKNAYTWSNTYPYTSVVDWIRPYQNIFYANTVLDGLQKIEPKNQKDQNKLNQIRGNALFHRSKAFYDLAQIYAPPYYSNTATQELGIPLRLESDINIPSVRSTLKQTYEQITKDLKNAIELLPVSPLYKTRGSKPAAMALLARVYLNMEDYDQAFNYSDAALQLDSTLIDYNSLITSNNYADKLFNTEVLFHCNSFGYTSVNSLARIDTPFYNSYHVKDLRREIFFRPSSTGYTYKGRYDHTTTARLFSGLAVDEVYLMRAECYARKGNKVAAIIDLNTLMIKRWKNDGSWTPFTATDANDALTKILTERTKELVFRCIRWTDLRRLNKDDRFKITIIRKIGGNTYILEPNSFRYTFPIPHDIIQITGVQQNKDW